MSSNDGNVFSAPTSLLITSTALQDLLLILEQFDVLRFLFFFAF